MSDAEKDREDRRRSQTEEEVEARSDPCRCLRAPRGGGGAGGVLDVFASAPARRSAAEPKPRPSPAWSTWKPFVVNLADPGGQRFLRVNDAAADLRRRAGRRAEGRRGRQRARPLRDSRAALAADTPTPLVTPEGKEELKKAIAERATARRARTEGDRCPLRRIRRPVTPGARAAQRRRRATSTSCSGRPRCRCATACTWKRQQHHPAAAVGRRRHAGRRQRRARREWRGRHHRRQHRGPRHRDRCAPPSAESGPV